MNNRWRIVFIASFVALLMEYSLRGINGFLRQPAMALLVFANYFTYLALIEEFIGRFKLRDYQIWVVAQFFGLLWQLVGVAGVYYPPFVLGIGLGTLLINNLVWWTTIQTVFALYIGHRLTPAAERSQPLLSKVGIFTFFGFYVAISASWRFFAIPPMTAWQLLVMLSLTILFARLSYKTITNNLKKGAVLPAFTADRLLDVLTVITIVYLIYSFFRLTGDSGIAHIINRQALRVNLVVSPLIALTLLLRRLASKKPIPI